MKELIIYILAAISAIALGSAAWFFAIPKAVELSLRVPGMDKRPVGEQIGQGGELAFDLEVLAPLKLENPTSPNTDDHPSSDNWPHFRGPNRDAIWKNNNYEIVQNWEAKPLECLWKIPVGEGYAGACIYDGIVYVLDYDTEKQRDVLRAINFETGKDIWNLSYPNKVKRDHGMSRSIPAITEKYIVTVGPKCHVMCVDRLTGNKLWHIDLVAEYQTKVPLWHASQCPIIIDDKAIIAPSGTKLMIAVDCATGKVVWDTANDDKWKMTHSSIMPLYLEGKLMYVYCGDGGICGVDSRTGKKLWVNYEWSMRTNVPTPIHIGGGKLFLCAGYNKGCALLDIYRTKNEESSPNPQGKLESSELYSYDTKMMYMKPATVFGAVQHTPVLYNDHIYGIRQDKRLVCLNLEGEIQWEAPKNDKYGDSPFMIVNDQLIALDDHGIMSLIELTPDKYNLLSRQQVLFGRESWGLMAISDGKIIVRDFTEMRCLRIAQMK